MISCDYIRPSLGRAVVLQLDLCDFTVLSQQHPPETLANIVNGLICDFDECVLASIGHMIKVDTIGDAYIGNVHTHARMHACMHTCIHTHDQG